MTVRTEAGGEMPPVLRSRRKALFFDLFQRIGGFGIAGAFQELLFRRTNSIRVEAEIRPVGKLPIPAHDR